MTDPQGLLVPDPGEVGDNCGPNWIWDGSLRGPCDPGGYGWGTIWGPVGGIGGGHPQPPPVNPPSTPSPINSPGGLPGGPSTNFIGPGAIAIGAGTVVCAGSGVCEVIAIGLGAAATVYYGYQIAKYIDQIITRSKTADPVTYPNVGQISRDSAGHCQRPPQWKWQASGNAHGSTIGYHWHWLTWNLADPLSCTYFPRRGGGANDPGPDYILVSGPMSTIP